jgi:hypothetical protein
METGKSPVDPGQPNSQKPIGDAPAIPTTSVVLKYFCRRTVQIVELAMVYGPPEQIADQKNQYQGQRDEQIENVHDQA